MKCPKCQTENPGKRKYCRECGAKLINVCPQCGAENPPEDKNDGGLRPSGYTHPTGLVIIIPKVSGVDLDPHLRGDGR